MTNIELTKAASKIHKLYGSCAAWSEIWYYLDEHTFSHHQEVTAVFAPQTNKMIEAALSTKTVIKWREHAKELKQNDHQSELSKKLYAHIKGCKDKDNVTIALTVEELETILEL